MRSLLDRLVDVTFGLNAVTTGMSPWSMPDDRRRMNDVVRGMIDATLRLSTGTLKLSDLSL